MGVRGDKTRIVLTITKELKAKLEIQAEKENRTVANLINNISIKYLEQIAKD
jgi:hypothetical protein